MGPQEHAEIARRHRADWEAGQPFVVGLLGDFSRRTRDELPPVIERRFRDVRLDSVDKLMAALVPIARVETDDHLSGRGRIALEVEFRSLADFEPEALLRRVPLLAEAAAGLAALGPGLPRAEREQALCAQLRALLQAEPLRELEASWRALHRLLVTLPDLPRLQVRVLDLSRVDLVRTLKRFRGTAWDQSPIYHLVVRDELATWGGRPFNLLLGDYAFSHAYEDTQCLRDLAAIADAAGCVFVAAAAPRLLGLALQGAAGELRAPRRLFEGAAYSAWRGLRADGAPGWLALVLPRVLARAPHRRALAAAGGIQFSEDASDPGGLPWASAVYAVGARLMADLVLRGGHAGLPDAPTGGIVEAAAGLPGTWGDAVDGRFAPDVAQELGELGLVVVEQQPGSRHLRYTAARSLAGGPADYLGWRMLCGRLMHGSRDLVRHLRGAAWTERDYEQAMLEWLLPSTATVAGPPDPPAIPLLGATLQLRAGEYDWSGSAQTPWTMLAVELSVELRPLRPGRSEHCSARGRFFADGGTAA